MVGRKEESAPSLRTFSVVHPSASQFKWGRSSSIFSCLPPSVAPAWIWCFEDGWKISVLEGIKVSSSCWNPWELSTRILYLENLGCKVLFLLEKLKKTFCSCCFHSGLTCIWHWKHQILFLGCLGDTWIAWQQHTDCNWDRLEALGCLWVCVAAFMKWREELKHTFDFGSCSRNWLAVSGHKQDWRKCLGWRIINYLITWGSLSIWHLLIKCL